MSTRTYSFTFAGAATLVAPGGVFFYIKSATAALTLRTRGSSSAPVEFTNVGAGLRFGPVPIDKRWTYLDLTSAVAQTVELVVSDDAEVDIASTVSVAGNVTVSDLPSTAIASPARVTRATGGASTIAANPARRRITIANPSDNATPGLLYVQAVGAGAGRGIPLDPGLFIELQTTAAIDIRNDSGASVDFTQFEET